MSCLRDRVVRTAGTRGELTLYELGCRARRQLDLTMVQVLLPRRAGRARRQGAGVISVIARPGAANDPPPAVVPAS